MAVSRGRTEKLEEFTEPHLAHSFVIWHSLPKDQRDAGLARLDTFGKMDRTLLE